MPEAPKLHILADAASAISTATASVHETIDPLVHDATAALGGGSSSSGHESENRGSTLTAEERTGAWTLGGILLGSWLLGGFFDAGSSLKEEAHDVAHAAQDQAEHAKAKGMQVAVSVTDKAAELRTKAGEQVDSVKEKGQQTAKEAQGKAADLKAKAGEQVQAAKSKASDVAAAASQKLDDVKSKVVGK
jgi:hypothetical protein